MKCRPLFSLISNCHVWMGTTFARSYVKTCSFVKYRLLCSVGRMVCLTRCVDDLPVLQNISPNPLTLLNLCKLSKSILPTGRNGCPITLKGNVNACDVVARVCINFACMEQVRMRRWNSLFFPFHWRG